MIAHSQIFVQDPDYWVAGAVRHPGRAFTVTIQLHRYAKYYREDGMEKRTLYKVFGIRLDILVNGKVRVGPLDPWDSSAMSLGR